MGRSSEYVLRIFHPTALIPVYMVRRGTLAERRVCRFRRRVVRNLHDPTPGVKQRDGATLSGETEAILGHILYARLYARITA